MMNTRYRKGETGTRWIAGVLAGAFAGIMGAALGAGLHRQGRRRRVPSIEQELAELRERTARHSQAARRLDHDLRAPVGAMAVALDLMSTTDDPALKEEAMQVLGRQLARMNTLTQRVHEFSREFNG